MTSSTASADTTISVRSVSKMYPLYAKPNDRLKQSLWYALPEIFRGKPREFYREFWALRDISFEIKKGESVGIIGRNGSGKSTLLQIIAGTLAPSWGDVVVKGRVAALLELSSGFNPEFTGRENVYMNGTIWGMSQAQIDDLYDDIVSFADVGQFINQPVKLYSSGMAVRLAFAVQAFVPKQILIVDEALSVGDAAFRRKCMAVLERFQENGGTFILVSHSTQTIVRHCQRCLLLSEGELLADGPSKPITDLYQKIIFSPSADARELVAQIRRGGWEHDLNDDVPSKQTKRRKFSQKPTNGATKVLPKTEPDLGPSDYFDPNIPQANEVVYGNGQAKIIDMEMYNRQGEKVNVLVAGREYQWRYKVRFFQDVQKVVFGFIIKTVDGIEVAGANNRTEKQPIESISADSIVEVVFKFSLNLRPASFFINSGVGSYIQDSGLIYLNRRVDCYTIRVLPPDNRQILGLSYVNPEFDYQILSAQES